MTDPIRAALERLLKAINDHDQCMIHKWGQQSKLPTQHPYRKP